MEPQQIPAELARPATDAGQPAAPGAGGRHVQYLLLRPSLATADAVISEHAMGGWRVHTFIVHTPVPGSPQAAVLLEKEVS